MMQPQDLCINFLPKKEGVLCVSDASDQDIMQTSINVPFDSNKQHHCDETFSDAIYTEPSESISNGSRISQGRLGTCFYNTFSKMGKGSLRGSILTLINSAIGVGAYVLPNAFRMSGIILAISICLLSSLSALCSTKILLKSQNEYETKSYSALSATLIHPKFGILTKLLMISHCFITITSFLYFTISFSQSFTFFLHLPKMFANKWFLSALLLVCSWPLSIQRTFGKLQYFALLPTIVLIATVFCIFGAAHLYWHHVNNISLWKFDIHFFESFNVILFAYMQHLSICQIGIELHQPTKRRFKKVLNRSILTETFFFLSTGLMGYLSFGDATRPNILMNYPSSSCLFFIVKVCVTLCFTITIPLIIIPTSTELLSVISICSVELKAFVCGANTAYVLQEDDLSDVDPKCNQPYCVEELKNDEIFNAADEGGKDPHAIQEKDTQQFDSTLLPPAPVSDLVNENHMVTYEDTFHSVPNNDDTSEDLEDVPVSQYSRAFEISVTTCYLLLTYVVACSISNISHFVSLAGGVTSSFLACILPALIYFFGLGARQPKWKRYFVTIFVALGGCIALLGSLVQLLREVSLIK